MMRVSSFPMRDSECHRQSRHPGVFL